MRASSFNIVHLAIALLIVVVVFVIAWVVLSGAGREQKRYAASNQLRGVHQGLVTMSNSNKEWFVGLDSQGDYVTPASGQLVGTGDAAVWVGQQGIDIQSRFAMLIEGEFFTPDYAVSPSEIDANIRPWDRKGRMTAEHYSYAMLQVPKQGGRHTAWGLSLNGHAILLSDRNLGTADKPRSIHSDGGPWRGHVVWNDNHSAYEMEHVYETQYGEAKPTKDDHLFASPGVDDALLIHRGN